MSRKPFLPSAARSTAASPMQPGTPDAVPPDNTVPQKRSQASFSSGRIAWAVSGTKLVAPPATINTGWARRVSAAGGEVSVRQFDAGGRVLPASAQRFADGGSHAGGQRPLMSEMHFEAQHRLEVVGIARLALMRQPEARARLGLLTWDCGHGPPQPG